MSVGRRARWECADADVSVSPLNTTIGGRIFRSDATPCVYFGPLSRHIYVHVRGTYRRRKYDDDECHGQIWGGG